MRHDLARANVIAASWRNDELGLAEACVRALQAGVRAQWIAARINRPISWVRSTPDILAYEFKERTITVQREREENGIS
jgi:hypothetical protein